MKSLFTDPLKNHEAIQTLAKNIDLKRSCGYVTMMHSMSPLQSKSDVSLCSTAVQTPITPSIPTAPLNGIKDDASRQLLALELDQLNVEEGVDSTESSTSALKHKPKNLVLKNSSAVSNFYNHEEWTLLDCCFGIPLFDSALNKDVCERVIKHKLCQESRLVVFRIRMNVLLTT